MRRVRFCPKLWFLGLISYMASPLLLSFINWLDSQTNWIGLISGTRCPFSDFRGGGWFLSLRLLKNLCKTLHTTVLWSASASEYAASHNAPEKCSALSLLSQSYWQFWASLAWPAPATKHTGKAGLLKTIFLVFAGASGALGCSWPYIHPRLC